MLHHRVVLAIFNFRIKNIDQIGELLKYSEDRARHLNAESSGDDDLSLGRVQHAKQVGHLQLGVGQRDGLLEKLDRPLQVASLDLQGAQRLVGELALVVKLDGALDVLLGLGDVASPLEVDEAAVNKDVGVGRVGLHGALVARVSLFELLLVTQNLEKETDPVFKVHPYSVA